MTNLSPRRARVGSEAAQSLHEGREMLAQAAPEPLPQLSRLLGEPTEIQYF